MKVISVYKKERTGVFGNALVWLIFLLNQTDQAVGWQDKPLDRQGFHRSVIRYSAPLSLSGFLVTFASLSENLYPVTGRLLFNP